MVDFMDDDVFLHIVAAPGLDGEGISAPDALALRNDVNTLLARPVIAELDDVPDVNAAAPVSGDVLVFDGTNWVSAAHAGSVQVLNFDASFNESGITGLLFLRPLTAALHPTVANRVNVGVTFGSAANTVAEGNHTHTVASGSSTAFNASGYMSSSSRTLVTTTRVLNAGIEYLVKATLKPQMRGADAGPAYFTMTTTINGNARTSPGGATSGFWCVQGVPNKESWSHYQTIVGTGAAITISGSVAYHSGAGFNVDAGEIEIELIPRR